VPGAMVSLVCSNALNRSVKEFGLRITGEILDKTRDLVLETFAKSSADVKDGMDISLISINSTAKKINWSGANNPLWYSETANRLLELKADKQPIGKTDHPQPFTTHEIEYKTNTTFYLFTDGYPDQFGGPKGKKYKYKQLEEKLTANCDKEMKEQKNILESSFEDWIGSLEQVDDVTIIGIKL
jgi:serine phosphatase RsbU (regulator of sigma subunit)